LTLVEIISLNKNLIGLVCHVIKPVFNVTAPQTHSATNVTNPLFTNIIWLVNVKMTAEMAIL
jgi:predicted transglutaminase-like protease